MNEFYNTILLKSEPLVAPPTDALGCKTGFAGTHKDAMRVAGETSADLKDEEPLLDLRREARVLEKCIGSIVKGDSIPLHSLHNNVRITCASFSSKLKRHRVLSHCRLNNLWVAFTEVSGKLESPAILLHSCKNYLSITSAVSCSVFKGSPILPHSCQHYPAIRPARSRGPMQSLPMLCHCGQHDIRRVGPLNGPRILTYSSLNDLSITCAAKSSELKGTPVLPHGFEHNVSVGSAVMCSPSQSRHILLNCSLNHFEIALEGFLNPFEGCSILSHSHKRSPTTLAEAC
mmetsp:Transcript_284/g.792  ORF Transcript_284/g.792 Transcript_284/m.792 type:complete len:288 (-) Transcript_284:71-934(-)